VHKKYVQDRSKNMCTIVQRICADIGPKIEPGFSQRYGSIRQFREQGCAEIGDMRFFFLKNYVFVNK